MAEKVVGPDLYIGGKDNQRTDAAPTQKPRKSSVRKQMSGKDFKRRLERLKKRGVSEYRGMSRS